MADAVTRKICAGFDPAGPVIFMGGKTGLPAGFVTLGTDFLVRFPQDVTPHLGAAAPGGRMLKDLDAAPDLTAKLETFWSEALEAMLPHADAPIPYSREGTTRGAVLAGPRADAAERGAASAGYLRSAARGQAPAPRMQRFAALWLRQIAVLPLPSASRAEVSWDNDEACRLDFRESADLGLLFARLSWNDDEEGHASKRIRPRRPDISGDYALWLAVLRAAQLARLAIGSGLPAQTRLVITVSHQGMTGQCLQLCLAPSDRGLRFAQLIHALPRTLRACLTREPALDALQLSPVLAPDEARHLQDEAFTDTRRGAGDLRWHGATAAAERRLTYAGEAAASADYPAGLPFALSAAASSLPPDPRVRVIAPARGSEQRLALEAWLAGPRRGAGLRPGFAEVYLSGLEYRLLCETPDAAETSVLVTEIRELRRLTGGGQPLHLAASGLLDWLEVTGRLAGGPVGTLGPLAQLALLGCAVMEGRPLLRDELLHLWRRWHPGAADTLSLRDADAEIGEGLKVPVPARPLLISYRSVSGLCDAARVPVQREGRAIPDLRASATLARVFDRLSFLATAE